MKVFGKIEIDYDNGIKDITVHPEGDDTNGIISEVNDMLKNFIKIYQKGIDIIEVSGDKKFEDMEEEYRLKMENIEEEYEDKIGGIVTSNSDKEHSMVDKYDKIVLDLREEIRRVKGNIDMDVRTKVDGVKEMYDIVLRDKDNQIEKLERSMEGTLSNLNMNIENMNMSINYKSNDTKRYEGENLILEILNEEYSDFNKNVKYNLVSGKGKEGDICIDYYGYIGCLESKNKKQPNSDDIKKLFRDLDETNTYNFGIMISIKKNVKFLKNVRNFDIQFSPIKKKPVLFIAELEACHEYLPLSLNILKYIIDSGIDINFVQIIRQYISNLDSILKLNNNMYKCCLEQKKQIKKLLSEFKDFVNKNGKLEEEEKKEEIEIVKMVKNVVVKKRKKSAYSIFLSDSSIISKLMNKYPNKKTNELNKEKGEMWRAMDQTKYVLLAGLLNDEKMEEDDLVLYLEKSVEELRNVGHQMASASLIKAPRRDFFAPKNRRDEN